MLGREHGSGLESMWRYSGKKNSEEGVEHRKCVLVCVEKLFERDSRPVST